MNIMIIISMVYDNNLIINISKIKNTKFLHKYMNKMKKIIDRWMDRLTDR